MQIEKGMPHSDSEAILQANYDSHAQTSPLPKLASYHPNCVQSSAGGRPPRHHFGDSYGSLNLDYMKHLNGMRMFEMQAKAK